MINILSLSNFELTMVIIWAIVVIAALIIEFETANLVSIWFAAGGISGLICAVCHQKIWLQILLFAVISGLFVIATRPFVKKISDNQTIQTNADRLIGMKALVTKEIKEGVRGEILVEYQNWPAVSKGDSNFNIGDHVVVVGISGNKMIVKEIENINL